MSQYGEVGRIYLHPESAQTRKRRIKNGGNHRRKFTDGWVEFLDKRIAKAVALSLNNQPIGFSFSFFLQYHFTPHVGGKKRFFSSMIWNIKYLPKFKWRNLTERICLITIFHSLPVFLRLLILLYPALRQSENSFFMRSKTMEAKKRARFAAEQMDKAKRKRNAVKRIV